MHRRSGLIFLVLCEGFQLACLLFDSNALDSDFFRLFLDGKCDLFGEFIFLLWTQGPPGCILETDFF